MRRTLQAKLLIVVVFAVGLLTGAVLMDVYETRVFSRSDGGDRRAGLFRHDPSFSEFLELTEEQQVEVRAILETTRESFRQLRRQTRPMYDELRENSRNQIRALLTEEQLERYDTWMEQAERDRNGSGRKDR